MSEQQKKCENTCDETSKRNLWHAMADHWFQDLDKGEELSDFIRWLIATLGSLSYLLIFLFYESPSLSEGITQFTQILLIVVISCGFGFLLAWKRKKTGPVRLYISGLLLPALVLNVTIILKNINA